MYRYKITTGDYSNDGHCISEAVYVETSIDKAKIEELNKKLTDKLGFNFVKKVCGEFQEHYPSHEHYVAISNFLGRDMEEYFYFGGGEVDENGWESEYQYFIEDGGHFIKVLFTLLQKIEPFEFKIIEDDTEDIEFLNGAGYGLYSC